MYQYDAVTELQLIRFRRQQLDERLEMLRLIHEAGLDRPGLPAQIVAAVAGAFARVAQKPRRPVDESQSMGPVVANREKVAA
jgi:hypothetical protein